MKRLRKVKEVRYNKDVFTFPQSFLFWCPQSPNSISDLLTPLSINIIRCMLELEAKYFSSFDASFLPSSPRLQIGLRVTVFLNDSVCLTKATIPKLNQNCSSVCLTADNLLYGSLRFPRFHNPLSGQQKGSDLEWLVSRMAQMVREDRTCGRLVVL